MSLENFKRFVRNKPILVEHVNRGEISWQSLYDMYELYGENSDVWSKYLNINNKVITLKDVFDNIKNIDVTEVQNTITSLQKGITYLEDILKTKEKELPIRKSSYEERPLYKYFND